MEWRIIQPISLYIDIKEMCASIGVDPLASGKGFWSNMLDIGDFYYELGIDMN